jgi:hypothetical protein
MPAISTFFVLVLALLPIFAGESSARMEGVILCSAERGKAAAGKMLAAPYTFGLPVFIIALCFWLAPRQFLRRRKA